MIVYFSVASARPWGGMQLRRLAAAFLVVCLAGGALLPAARAQKVQEAENSIVDRRVARTLEQFGRISLRLPGALASDRDVYVLLATGAAYADVRVLARPGGVQPETLARALGESVRGTDLAARPVTWSRGDEFSAARVSLSSGRFGAREAARVFPAGRIVDGLRRAGYAPHVLLSVPRHAVQDARLAALPRQRMQASWWYDATRVGAEDAFQVKARLPSVSLAFTLAFFVFVPTVGALGLLAAVVFGTRRSVPITTRRRLYPKLATWPTFAAIALHAPFVVVFLRSPHPRVVGDLWFGTSSLASAFLPFLMAGPLVMMLLLPLTKRVEVRLFGPSEDASPAAVAAPEMSPEEKAARKSVLLWGLVPNALGLALILAKDVIAPRPSPLRPFIFPAGMMFIMGGSHLVRWLLRGRLQPFETPPVLDEALSARARILAGRMGVTRLKSVQVDDSRAGRATANALVGPNGRIIVSSRLRDALSEPEMDFVLAHEIAHLRGGHFARGLIVSLLGAALLFLPMVLLLSGRRVLPAGNALATLSFLLPLAGFFVVFVASFWLRRQREHEADRLALSATGDLSAALNALATMAANSPLPHLHEMDTLSTHPKLSRRFASLRQIARTLNHSAER